MQQPPLLKDTKQIKNTYIPKQQSTPNSRTYYNIHEKENKQQEKDNRTTKKKNGQSNMKGKLER